MFLAADDGVDRRSERVGEGGISPYSMVGAV
jgi:hypothetical protein